MRKLSSVIASACLVLFTAPAQALDLKEAFERARQYDAQFQAAYATYLATVEASDLSTSAILPQVGFNAFIQRGNRETDRAGSPTVESDNDVDGYSVYLNQVLFDKTTFDNMDEGDAIVVRAVADLEAAKLDTIVRVAEAYFNVLTAIDTLETATAEKIAIGKQLEQSTERFNVGLSAITDVKEQQASYDVSVANEIIAINDLSNARESLRVIINMYPENLKVASEEIPLVMMEPDSIDAWQDKSLQGNFDLKSVEASVQAAEASYEASRGGHYPTLSLNASYGVQDSAATAFFPQNEATSSQITLNLDVPIYTGGFTSSTVRQKLSELDANKAAYEQQRRVTLALSRSAYLTLKADIAQVRARKRAVESSQTSLDATLAGYDAGTRTSVDVLLQQRQLFSAKRDYSVARYAYLTNRLKLKQIAGTLGEQDIIDINEWLVTRPPAEESETRY